MKKFMFPALFFAGITLPQQILAQDFYFGADLSYANEMEDCGAIYKIGGQKIDPFKAFSQSGTNLVRIRIWNNAEWTKYSNLADVEKSLSRARQNNMKTLLDFHYSDDWADGDKQIAPKAWARLSDDEQAKALYKYTYDTLMALDSKGLLPDMVQVGNETNHEILSSLAGAKKPIDWQRNALLFNAGIKAVRDVEKQSGKKIKIMLHIAQPENVGPWFEAATKAGIKDYDIIGMSYYKKWSNYTFTELSGTIRQMREKYNKEVIIVETAYPFTLDNADTSPNLLDADLAAIGYPASPQGQLKYLTDLTQIVMDNGGEGVVYWEPDWISTKCHTRWGQGSDWDNATFFDNKGEALPSLKWPQFDYVRPVKVTFSTKSESDKLYLGADFLAGINVEMQKQGNIFTYTTQIRPQTDVIFAAAPTEQNLENADAHQAKTPQKDGDMAF